MKRITRSKSGKEIYGQKWQNIIESNTSYEKTGNDSTCKSPSLKTHKTALLPDDDDSPPPAVSETNHVADQDQTDQQASEEIMERKQSFSTCHESMYKATLQGDCVAAEMLLEQLPNLATDELNEERDRALHIAAAFKHKKLVKILVQRLSATDLKLLDGNGYTACCYAAISGVVDIADVMIRKNRTLAMGRDRESKTPLYKAASRGNAKMLSYFLKTTKVEDMAMEEWFHLLLLTIGRKMYGVALEISRMNEQLATMSNGDQGTALHLLARQHFIEINKLPWMLGVERQDIRSLAKNLWEDIHKLGKDIAVKLMKNPPILHNAAEVGNVQLITMITRTYPELVWDKDSRGYTIFHIAVMNRHADLFALFNEIGARKDAIAASEDENGNNILHLAAKLADEILYCIIM